MKIISLASWFYYTQKSEFEETKLKIGPVLLFATLKKYCDAVRTRWFLRDKRGHCQRGYENVHWLSCFTHACENQAAATASVKKGNAAGF